MKKDKRDGVLGRGGAGDSVLGLFSTVGQNIKTIINQHHMKLYVLYKVNYTKVKHGLLNEHHNAQLTLIWIKSHQFT